VVTDSRSALKAGQIARLRLSAVRSQLPLEPVRPLRQTLRYSGSIRHRHFSSSGVFRPGGPETASFVQQTGSPVRFFGLLQRPSTRRGPSACPPRSAAHQQRRTMLCRRQFVSQRVGTRFWQVIGYGVAHSKIVTNSFENASQHL